MSYFAQVDNNIVQRVIVADSAQWCTDHLGGVWVETADPYGPPQTVNYCGPGHTCDESFPERFAVEWVAPAPDPETGEWSSYPRGAVMAHNGQLWRSTTDNNVWEPGVSGWHPFSDIEGVLPDWIRPTGAHDTWWLGAEVAYGGKRWESLIPDNVTVPGSDPRWWRDMDAPVEPVGPQAWVPWSGLNEDLHQVGDLVTHNGQTWEATVGNNHWEPGTFGWVVV